MPDVTDVNGAEERVKVASRRAGSENFRRTCAGESRQGAGRRGESGTRRRGARVCVCMKIFPLTFSTFANRLSALNRRVTALAPFSFICTSRESPVQQRRHDPG